MAINSISLTNSTNGAISRDIDPDLAKYNELNTEWSKYSNNQYLSSDLKDKISKQLKELESLIDNNKEEENNEEIAKSIASLIASLTVILNGSDSMMSMADRVKCLESLANFEDGKDKNKDLGKDTYNTIYSNLNNLNMTYKKQEEFYSDIYNGIFEVYSNRLDDDDNNIKKEIQKSINGGGFNSLDVIYKDFCGNIIEGNKNDLKSSDYSNLKNENFASASAFFSKLATCLIAYSVYATEQNNISSSSRSNLANNTISMQVMKSSNAYRMLDLDNLMSEELNKRAEMDPAMKRLRDGNYWADNKEIDHHENVRPEDELWTKKPE